MLPNSIAKSATIEGLGDVLEVERWVNEQSGRPFNWIQSGHSQGLDVSSGDA